MEACLVHFGYDFDFDEQIKEVNALLDPIPPMIEDRWKPKTKILTPAATPPEQSIVVPPQIWT